MTFSIDNPRGLQQPPFGKCLEKTLRITRVKEDQRKIHLSGTGILTHKWQMRKFQINKLVDEM